MSDRIFCGDKKSERSERTMCVQCAACSVDSQGEGVLGFVDGC